MKHARPDYDERIQDSAGLIPDDEPVLLIRGQDDLAIPMLDDYIDFYEHYSERDERVLELLYRHRERIEDWQMHHGSKVADLPAAVRGVS